MKYGTSLRTRHIVGRLEKGEEFVDAMRRLCTRERVRAGTFRAVGVFSAVELQDFVDGKYVNGFTADTPLDILSLTGNISTLGTEVIINASTMLAYTIYRQHQVVGGHLNQGRVHICEFELIAYDDLVLERTYDAATGLPLWNRIGGVELAERAPAEPLTAEPTIAPVAAPPAETTDDATKAANTPPTPPSAEELEAAGVHVATPKTEPTVIRRGSARVKKAKATESVAPATPEPTPASTDEWQAAIHTVKTAEKHRTLTIPSASSKETPARPENNDDDDAYIEPGDVLVHHTLGRCHVKRVDDDEWAFIVTPTGKNRKLALHLFELNLVDETDDNHNVYKLKKRRPR